MHTYRRTLLCACNAHHDTRGHASTLDVDSLPHGTSAPQLSQPSIADLCCFIARHVRRLLQMKRSSGERGLQVCLFDNRGVGCSESPLDRSAYRTTIMAKDGLRLMVRCWMACWGAEGEECLTHDEFWLNLGTWSFGWSMMIHVVECCVERVHHPHLLHSRQLWVSGALWYLCLIAHADARYLAYLGCMCATQHTHAQSGLINSSYGHMANDVLWTT